jgi:hypothetical protein
VLSPRAGEIMRGFQAPLPELGVGAAQALRELIDRGIEASTATSGPRFFHWVTGGTQIKRFVAQCHSLIEADGMILFAVVPLDHCPARGE